MSIRDSRAQSVELEWDGSSYTATLTAVSYTHLLMKGAVTVLFGFGCKFEHIQFNTSVFTLKEQNHANFVPELCQLFARFSGR